MSGPVGSPSQDLHRSIGLGWQRTLQQWHVRACVELAALLRPSLQVAALFLRLSFRPIVKGRAAPRPISLSPARGTPAFALFYRDAVVESRIHSPSRPAGRPRTR